jgi:HK97 family phage major capsid protein
VSSIEAKRLIDVRQRAVNEFRTSEEPETQRKAWDAAEEARSSLDSMIVEVLEREEQAAEEAREAAAVVQSAAPKSDLPVDEIRAVARGERGRFEDMLDFRADIVTSDSTVYAQYTVPQSWASTVINFQIAQSGLLQAGPTILTTQGGNQINLPALLTDAAAVLTAEGSAATQTNPVFTTIPLNAYRFDGYFSVSNEVLDDTGVDLTGLLRTYAGRAIAAKVNPYFTDPDTGDGSSKPAAVQVGCTSALTAASYSALTLEELKQLYYTVLPVYRANGKWVGNSALTLAIAQMRDDTGAFIWQPSLASAEPDRFMGKPWFEDAYMDSFATGNEPVIFGDIAAGYTVRYAHGGMQFIASKEFAVTSFETTFVWGLWMDAVATDAKAIYSITLP